MMNRPGLFLILPALLFAGHLAAVDLKTIDDFQSAAARAHVALSAPDWEETPEALAVSTKDALAGGNTALAQIGQQNAARVTFKSTIVALEDLRAEAGLVTNRAALIRQTHPDPAMRAAAENALKTWQDWSVAMDYREDVYHAIKAFAATRPRLSGEDQKLFEETLRDYRRAGMDLPPDGRKELELLRRDLAQLTAEFERNLLAAQAPVVFTKAELDGVPDDFLSSPGIQLDHDRYQVMANLTWQYNTVEDTARREETRRRLYVAHDALAKTENVPVINQILGLRNRIALRLGYPSWADYQADIRMAKTAATARRYIEDLAAGIQPKFEAELREMQKLKAADTGDPAAKIDTWDWRYYTNQLTKQNFAVDRDALRVFFPFQQTLDGMLAVFGRVFGIRFDEIKPPREGNKYFRPYVISDTASHSPLGLLYLDLFPRDGKGSGGGETELVNGRRLPGGKYQAPVAAVILNFPPPGAGKLSLLSHAETEILFHELGHALHCTLTRAKYSRFAGTNVPTDFVEAPSQMLQNWIWDDAVLRTFAADYRDPSKKIPPDTIRKLKEARQATAGMFYRRQFAFALLDLALHGPHPSEQPYDCLAISNPILERVFLPIDPQTSFIASFRGFDGYDACYYGYAWSDAMAADMATVFEKAREGYLDRSAGLKLRREIYEQGASRDVSISVEKFLGRKRSVAPFLKKLGLNGAQGPSQTPP